MHGPGDPPERRALTSQHTVVVCRGKSCARKRPDDHAELVRVLDEAGVDHVTSKCLGVCRGPVAVVGPAGEVPVVVEKVRKKKHRKRLVAVACGAKDPGALGGRVVGGKERAKAEARARRAVERTE